MNTPHISLERRLYEAGKTTPRDEFRESLKAFLFSQIGEKNEVWFLQVLQGIESSDSLGGKKEKIWSRILEKADAPITPSLQLFKKYQGLLWKIFAGITVSLLFFSLAGRYILGVEYGNTPRSTIASVSEEGLLVRGAEKYALAPDQKIISGDVLHTQEGRAELTFFDRSYVYMDQNTELVIKKITPDPSSRYGGDIELYLQKGKIWVRTFQNKWTEPNLHIETNTASFAPIGNATFDIYQKGNDVHLRVWEASVRTTNFSPAPANTLIAGTKVQLSYLGNIEREYIRANDKNEIWIQESFTKDTQYLEQLRATLLEQKQQEIGVLPGSLLYPIKKGFEKNIFMSVSVQEIAQVLQKRLTESFLLLRRGDTQLALATLESVEQSLQKQLQEYPEFQILAEDSILEFINTLILFGGDIQNTDILEYFLRIEEHVFPERIALSYKNTLLPLWELQYSLLKGDGLALKQKFEKYQEYAANMTLQFPLSKEVKKELLRIKIQELQLLNALYFRIFADRDIKASETRAITEALQILENKTNVENLLWNGSLFSKEENPVYIFLDKTEIYKSLQGKRNQARYLLEDVESIKSLAFLQELREEAEEELRDIITYKIIDILEAEQQKLVLETS